MMDGSLLEPRLAVGVRGVRTGENSCSHAAHRDRLTGRPRATRHGCGVQRSPAPASRNRPQDSTQLSCRLDDALRNATHGCPTVSIHVGIGPVPLVMAVGSSTQRMQRMQRQTIPAAEREQLRGRSVSPGRSQSRQRSETERQQPEIKQRICPGPGGRRTPCHRCGVQTQRLRRSRQQSAALRRRSPQHGVYLRSSSRRLASGRILDSAQRADAGRRRAKHPRPPAVSNRPPAHLRPAGTPAPRLDGEQLR